jgi:Tol biopolymer transport system component/DNA-binding winged helix-turn-helix (wHTH) protein
MTGMCKIYEFAGFRLDAGDMTLRQRGELVQLTPKVFETLVLLVENAGRLVNKDEFMAAIWPEQFVEESNITFNIKMLRKALGDNAAAPQFIETVPRRGYRFIAPVQESVAPVPPPPRHSAVPPHLLNYRHFAAIALLITLAATFGLAMWSWRQQRDAAQAPILLAELASTKLSETGKVRFAEISPNGKYVVYLNEVNGKHSLWLRQLATSNNAEIVPANGEKYYGLAFSRDGETIFFVRRPDKNGAPADIYGVPLVGGVPQKIASNTQGWISVSPDDKQIAFVRYTSTNSGNQLMLVDVDGKNERVVKVSEARKVFWVVAFAPDGKTIAASYGHTNGAAQMMSLQEVDVATGEMRELSTERYFNIGDIEWLPGQNGLLFSNARALGDPVRLSRLDYKTRQTEEALENSVGYAHLSLDEKAEKLVATTATFNYHLLVNEIGGSGAPRELTQARDGVAFAPDGRIVYASDSAGSEDIWIINPDGGNARQLTTDKSLDAYPLVSSDNRYIYFSSNRTGANQIWRMNLDGTNQTQLSKNEGGFPEGASPDGKWLYYRSTDSRRVLKVSTEGGEGEPLFKEKTGYYQAFSPDGSRMAFLRSRDGGGYELAVMSLAEERITGTFLIPPVTSGFPYSLKWSADGQFLSYYQPNEAGRNILWKQPVDGAKAQECNDLGADEMMAFAVSPDGKAVAYIRGEVKFDALLFTGLK